MTRATTTTATATTAATGGRDVDVERGAERAAVTMGPRAAALAVAVMRGAEGGTPTCAYAARRETCALGARASGVRRRRRCEVRRDRGRRDVRDAVERGRVRADVDVGGR